MLLNLFDDVLLLHLALKSAQGVFKRLTFLDDNFRHAKLTSRCLYDAAMGDRPRTGSGYK